MNIQKTIDNLQRNNIDVYYITSVAELKEKIFTFIPENATIGYGGSVTLDRLGVKEWIRERADLVLLDRDHSKTPEIEMKQALTSDVFLMSSNAITENGELYNVDGRGNRCAALIFGPDQVFVVCGTNKIVADLEEAKKRVETIAAPKNAQRLNLNSPCIKVGHCVDCRQPDRICCSYVVTNYQRVKGRIKVFLLDDILGF